MDPPTIGSILACAVFVTFASLSTMPNLARASSALFNIFLATAWILTKPNSKVTWTLTATALGIATWLSVRNI